jgi:hypothetical protein
MVTSGSWQSNLTSIERMGLGKQLRTAHRIEIHCSWLTKQGRGLMDERVPAMV